MRSGVTPMTVPSIISKNIDLFLCPACGGDLDILEGRLINCVSCGNEFPCDGGIPLLFWPNEWDDSREDVTHIVKAFYEENPFPNYDDIDSPWSLREKAHKGLFARLLDEQIPHSARILDVGCGTGQLSNFLGMTWGRTVFGTDLCLNSLRLGNEFKEQNQIDNAAFVQMNLFRPVFKPGTFDIVIGNGVLHHTNDPFGGFQSIARLVKPGAFVLIGLYNKYGRIPTDFRRFLFKVSGDRFKFLDSRLRDKSISETRRQTWFMDQYKHPHESKHTIGEVQKWFDQTGFEFTNAIPKAVAFEPFAMNEELFKKNQRGTKFDHALVQLGMLLSGGKEGGFFMMIGRKKS